MTDPARHGPAGDHDRLVIVEAEVGHVREDLQEVKEDVKGLRALIIGLSLTIATSCIVVALAVTFRPG